MTGFDNARLLDALIEATAGQRALFVGMGIEGANDPDWPSTIAWSNLYRVAPYDGENPPAPLMTSIDVTQCADPELATDTDLVVADIGELGRLLPAVQTAAEDAL